MATKRSRTPPVGDGPAKLRPTASQAPDSPTFRLGDHVRRAGAPGTGAITAVIAHDDGTFSYEVLFPGQGASTRYKESTLRNAVAAPY